MIPLELLSLPDLETPKTVPDVEIAPTASPCDRIPQRHFFL